MILIKVPPLRERVSDIPELVESFIVNISKQQNVKPKPIDAQAMQSLCRMPWSGNIRELRNVVERLMILSGDVISERDVELYCHQ